MIKGHKFSIYLVALIASHILVYIIMKSTGRLNRKTSDPYQSPGKSILRDRYSPHGSHHQVQRFDPTAGCFQTDVPLGASEAERRVIKEDNQKAVRAFRFNARGKAARDNLSEETRAAANLKRSLAAETKSLYDHK